MILISVSSGAIDRLPEPALIVYGQIEIDHVIQTAGDSVTVVAWVADHTEIARCNVRRNEDYDDQYVLRIPLESQNNVLYYAGTQIRTADGEVHIELQRFVPDWGQETVDANIVEPLDLDSAHEQTIAAEKGKLLHKKLYVLRDKDGDGISDTQELAWGLNPEITDTDGDGVSDYDEIAYDKDARTYDPFDPDTGRGKDLNARLMDSDGDGLTDGNEFGWGTLGIDDYMLDFDGDSYLNWEEIKRETDPNDSEDYPEASTFYVGPNGTHDATGSSEDPFYSIQMAVNETISGDTVLVYDANYVGEEHCNIEIIGRRITVEAVSWESSGAESCVIDCNNTGRGMTIGPDAGETCVLGFTIKSGFADNGAAIYCLESQPVIKNCLLINNVAEGDGGAVYVTSANPCFDNVTFSGNVAGRDGGALYCDANSVIEVKNSILSVNTARNRGREICLNDAIRPEWKSQLNLSHCSISDYPESLYVGDSCEFSAISVGVLEEGDPLFVNHLNGDYHLQSPYGQWDSSIGDWIVYDSTIPLSPCIDAGDPDASVGYEVYRYGKRNIGAYGGTSQASKSSSDMGSPEDLNGDGVVNFHDFAVLAQQWQKKAKPLKADLNTDGQVDWSDLFSITENWGMHNSLVEEEGKEQRR